MRIELPKAATIGRSYQIAIIQLHKAGTCTRMYLDHKMQLHRHTSTCCKSFATKLDDLRAAQFATTTSMPATTMPVFWKLSYSQEERAHAVQISAASSNRFFLASQCAKRRFSDLIRYGPLIQKNESRDSSTHNSSSSSIHHIFPRLSRSCASYPPATSVSRLHDFAVPRKEEAFPSCRAMPIRDKRGHSLPRICVVYAFSEIA